MQDLLDEQSLTIQKTLQFRWWVILIWVAVFAIGCAFRIMHWPGGSICCVLGAGGFMAYSFSFLLMSPQKSVSVIILNCISLLWTIILLWGVFFNDGYPLNKQGLLVHVITFAVLLLLHFVSLYFIRKNRNKRI